MAVVKKSGPQVHLDRLNWTRRWTLEAGVTGGLLPKVARVVRERGEKLRCHGLG